MIAIGQSLPAGEFTFISENGKQVQQAQSLFAGKKIILFAVPGAFTPTCSKAHLPGYLVLADEIKNKGVDEIVCLSVNDAYVMKAWRESQHAEAITFLADGDGSWCKAMGLSKDTGSFGGIRAQRFALIAEDGVVQHLVVEQAGKFEVSDAQSMLALL